MLGALIEYITTPKKDFQPMNARCSEDEEGSKDKVHSGEGFEGNGKFRRKNFNP
jgi:L-amino acid N-acyltransferase YncA